MVSRRDLEIIGHGIFFALTFIFSLAPIFINGFDAAPGDDAQRLEAAGLEHKRYLGHLIGVYIIPMYWYFYITPSLVYLGLAVLLRKAAPLAWILLFIVTIPILNHMSAGSHIPIVNFYLIGSLIIASFASKRYILGGILLVVSLIFHTSTGLFLLTGVTAYLAVTQYRKVIYTIPTWALGGISLIFIDIRTIFQVGNLKYWPRGETSSIVPENVFGSITSDMFPGIAAGILVALVITILSFLIRDKASLKSLILEPKILILLSLTLSLTIFTLVPHEILSDRATNALLGTVVILASLTLYKVVTTKTRLAFSSITVVAIIALAAPRNIDFWLNSGSYVG